MKVLQTITRLYVDREQLEASIAFYESFFGEPCGVDPAQEQVASLVEAL